MTKKTALYQSHLDAKAKMVDFAGWEMPIHYGSQLAEHQQVREAAGIFDVSHMVVVDLQGPEAAAFLRYILANNIDKLKIGKALYTCMLNEQGGVLDDLIVYKLADDSFRLVVNAGTAEKDLAWLKAHVQKFNCHLKRREDLAILATQGPKACEKLAQLFQLEASQLKELKPFHALSLQDKFVARTGYTGEDGFEWILPVEQAATFWQQLLATTFEPCGLGARDTLRLEAGLNLYGSDMDEKVTPLESNLAQTVDFEPKDRDFIGREALERQQQEGVKWQLVGLILEEQGIPRQHQKVLIEGLGEGEVTSGSFSPTLKKGIALARVPAGSFENCSIEIRGKALAAKKVKLPFVRRGQKVC